MAAWTVRLEPFTRDDVDRLVSWGPDDRFLHQWAGPTFRAPLDRKQIKRHLIDAGGRLPTLSIYKAVVPERSEVVGHGEIALIDRWNGSATLARILVGPPEWRGKGVGKVIVEGLLKIAFGDLGLHRVDLRVFDFNQPAIRCYEQAGFQKEGLLRDMRRFESEFWSVWVMSILDREWRECRHE